MSLHFVKLPFFNLLEKLALEDTRTVLSDFVVVCNTAPSRPALISMNKFLTCISMYVILFDVNYVIVQH